MYLELAGFFSLFILALFAFAETTRKPALGIIGSVLLCILGIWFITDGIQIQSGQTKTITQNSEICESLNMSCSSSAMTSTENMTLTYSNIPVAPFMPLQQVIGLVCVLLSLYGGLFFVMKVSEG